MVDIKLLKADAVNKNLCRLIDEHDEFHWAVAWGSMTNATTTLLKNSAKFRNVTFGVAFSQTDPDLVDALQGIERARVATKFAGGTYHPKVYGFRSGDRAAAIIGSANFTFGGLGSNWEASIRVTGDIADPFFVDIFNFTKESAKFGEAITPDFAAAYRASYRRASRMAKPPRDPMDGMRLIKPAGFTSPLASMNWAEYVAEVRASAHHDIEESLTLLRVAQEWFASVKSFADLSAGQRKAIAGLIGERQKTSLDLDRDWGWFGSMRGMGDFANRIDENDRHLARALDSVPQKGGVTRDHFRKFVKHFQRAFENSTRMGGVPTASRLLAMKRPDIFICICKPNIVEAAARMGFSRTTLGLDDYWDKVIEVLKLAEWYNTDKPDNAEGEIWENRAAMLDAILYRPS
ncbi:phospholipase D family protein [Mesorhizobium muleiense]|uniref:phospholipase D family protein n=1 Tax=Mesorhizobium muleiense TaxID=1004279 RepID=UPI001F1EBA29|nr:phospholipase D family protein [Mesorhizobium muleiense]MCF6110824.1 phospholipase D family protein [Mesorhizobium muleiense]